MCVPFSRLRHCLWEPYSQSRCCYGCEETENEVACCNLLHHDSFVMSFFVCFNFKGYVYRSYAEAGLDLSMIVSP